MELTITFAVLLFLSFWPYFALLGILNYKVSPQDPEKQLPGRPARRTVGRKNMDILKGILNIYAGYAIINGAFFALPEFRSELSDGLLFLAVCASCAVVFYFLSLVNRSIHGYITVGHMVIIHVLSCLSTFHIINAALHENYLELSDITWISLFCVGLMMMFHDYEREK